MAQKFNASWVSEDGTFGTGEIIVFEYDEMTGLEWNELDGAADSDKLRYVEAAILKPEMQKFLEAEGYKFRVESGEND